MPNRKKRSKRKITPKPRKHAVQVDLGAPRPVDGVKVTSDGVIDFQYNGVSQVPTSGHAEIGYDRSKGAKIQSRTWFRGAAVFAPPSHILLSADRVFWVDTNTNDHMGERIHTTVMLLAQRDDRAPRQPAFNVGILEGFEFRGDMEKPEPFAWAEVVERIRRNPNLPAEWKIAVVVDSELGRLGSINKQESPVWGEYYLPANFSLVYASADVGRDDPLNKFMHVCDREARALFDGIANTKVPREAGFVQSVVGGPPIRRWPAPGAPAA